MFLSLETLLGEPLPRERRKTCAPAFDFIFL